MSKVLTSFLISFNTVMPIAILLTIGALLKKKGTITTAFEVEANKLVFNWAMPMYLFNTIRDVNIGEGFSMRLVIFGMVIMIVGYAILAAVLPKYYTDMNDRRRIGAFISCSLHGGCAFPGIILCEKLLGGEAAVPFLLAMPIWSAFNPIFSITAFSMYSGCKMDAKETIKIMAKQVYKNPIIWGVVVAVAANIVDLQVPKFADSVIDYLAGLTTPLALVTLGARLKWDAFKMDFKQSITCGVLIKLVLLPVIGHAIAMAMGFSNNELAGLFIHLATPIGFGAYSIAVALNSDSQFYGHSLIVSHTLSCLTLFVEIFILSTLGVF